MSTSRLVTKPAGELHDGDRFVWCGRIVTVVGIVLVRLDGRSQRRGRRILTDIDGARRQLHYYDDDRVQVVA